MESPRWFHSVFVLVFGLCLSLFVCVLCWSGLLQSPLCLVWGAVVSFVFGLGCGRLLVLWSGCLQSPLCLVWGAVVSLCCGLGGCSLLCVVVWVVAVVFVSYFPFRFGGLHVF